jgi:hypothetical protein
MSTKARSSDSTLCALCLNIFQQKQRPNSGPYESWVDSPHHLDHESLQSAAVLGCSMCLALWNKVEEALKQKQFGVDFDASAVFFFMRAYDGYEVELRTKKEMPCSVSTNFKLQPVSGTVWPFPLEKIAS